MVDRPAFVRDFHAMFAKSAEFGKIGKGVSRLACSTEDGQIRDWFCGWLTNNGFKVIIDPIGNVFGLLEFCGPNAPVVLTGSHLDSQPNGGRFDGTYGVIASAQAALHIKRLADAGTLKPRRNLCVVNWTNEEGARFQPSLLGSSVYAGKTALDDALAIRDGEGVSVADALASIGYAGNEKPPRADKYVELHIECGPELENTQNRIGVTERWWGAIKLQVQVTGEQAHTGPTAMRERKDALWAASLLIAGIRHLADSENSDGTEKLYTSVGRIEVEPNSPNVVPASARIFVELRSSDRGVLMRAREKFGQVLREAGQRTRLPISILSEQARDAGEFDQHLVALAWSVSRKHQLPTRSVATIAGHDAIPLASVCQSVLVVTPSVGGICHHEDEFTADEDLENGLIVLKDMLVDLCSAADLGSS